MLDLDKFKKYIELTEQLNDRTQRLRKSDIDMMDYNDLFWTVINLFEKEIDPDGWISWFCFDNDFGRAGLEATDKDGVPTCRTVEELWGILNAATA